MATISAPPTPVPASIPADYHAVYTYGPPLQRLSACDSLRQQLRVLEAQLANEARLNGATWEEIAEALEITKQAAYQRFHGD